jgi:hypothetical protein
LIVSPLIAAMSYLFRAIINVSPLIAAEGYFFSLDRKEAKDQVSKEASSPHRPLPRNRQNHGPEIFCLLRPRWPLASAKVSNAPAARKASIVLPAFARSCFADAELRNSGNS